MPIDSASRTAKNTVRSFVDNMLMIGLSPSAVNDPV
jgi:hypothetical protein